MRKIALFALAGAAALALHAPLARADGIAVKAAMIPAAARATLVADIAAHKAQHPEAFTAVRNVKGVHREVYMTFRKPGPSAERELKLLGAAALLPMLEALAFDAPPRAGLSEDEWTALEVGMLNAAGVLRDPRSGPVLRAVFESAKRPGVQTAAAGAMGRLCGDADLAMLIAHSAAGQDGRVAAIHGLGECLRVESAKQLVALLAGTNDEATVESLGAALGSVGSSWAWKAMGPAAQATGTSVREVVAQALVTAFPRSKAARPQIVRSLAMVEHPGTRDLIAKARAVSDAGTAAALDELQKQLAP